MKIHRRNVSFEVTEGTPNENFWGYSDWERETYDVLSNWLKNDKIYIDIGAWIGPTVLFAAKLCKKVYTFEPDPSAWEELQSNIRLNGYTNIIAQNVAVGNNNGIIYMGSDNRLGESTTRVGKFQNGTDFSASCISIDDFLVSIEGELNDINFIKIDIEGGETEIAKSKMLKKLKIPTLVSIHPPMISDFDVKIENIIELAKLYDRCESAVGASISPDQLRNIRYHHTILLS